MKKLLVIAVFSFVASVSFAASHAVVDIKGVGAEKILVTVDVSGSPAFKRSLERNLDISGIFRRVNKGGSILLPLRL